MSRNLIDRMWDDEIGRSWTLCDMCDAPIASETALIAGVLEYRAEEAGAAYCEDCALAVMSMWREKMGFLPPRLGVVSE